MQLYFMNEQSAEIEDSYVEDGILSLPVFSQSNNYNSEDKVSTQASRINLEIINFNFNQAIGSDEAYSHESFQLICLLCTRLQDLTSLPIRTANELEMCHRLAIRSNETEMDNSSDDNNNKKNYHSFSTVDKRNGQGENINGNTNNRSPILGHNVYTPLKNVREETRRKLDAENQRSDSPITCTIKTSLKKVISYSCFKLGRCYW